MASLRVTEQVLVSIVKDETGCIESVTVYEKRKRGENQPEIKSYVGVVAICYSYGATYRQLDRQDSGLYTGKPLPTETLEVMGKQEALKKVEAIYKKIDKRRVIR